MGIVKVIFLLTLLSVSAHGYVKYPYLDRTDLCIMACDKCYKEVVLVNCANACLKTNGKPGNKWTIACPSLRSAENEVLPKSYD